MLSTCGVWLYIISSKIACLLIHNKTSKTLTNKLPNLNSQFKRHCSSYFEYCLHNGDLNWANVEEIRNHSSSIVNIPRTTSFNLMLKLLKTLTFIVLLLQMVTVSENSLHKIYSLPISYHRNDFSNHERTIHKHLQHRCGFLFDIVRPSN